jgi:peptidoglycan hydrolase-like protein with peptidoglycan-binding domain
LINDDILLAEIRDRLYELNYDPGPIDGPIGDAAYQAIREFQISSKMALTGEATNGAATAAT